MYKAGCVTYDKLWRHGRSQRICDLVGVLAHAAVSRSNRPKCIAKALLAAVRAPRRRPCVVSPMVAIATQTVERRRWRVRRIGIAEAIVSQTW